MNLKEIDPNIRNLIRWLNNNCYKTVSSCQGHLLRGNMRDDAEVRGYISFANTKKVMELMPFFLNHGFSIWSEQDSKYKVQVRTISVHYTFYFYLEGKVYQHYKNKKSIPTDKEVKKFWNEILEGLKTEIKIKK